MNKKIKYLFIGILIILFVLLFLGIKNIYTTISNNNEVKTLSTIEKYNYTLNENDSPYFKELFEELKTCLESEELDEEMYATLLSKLFVVDFYSLEYAISKSDVGGIQFVYSEYQSNFVTKAKDTIYNYIESDIYGKREQELPNVTNVEVSIDSDDYEGEKEEDSKAYYAHLTLTYEEDLDYPNEVSLILIHKDNKLQIVKMD